MDLLKDKICIVTGAGRGIGRTIAERYAQEGGIVYALDIKHDDLQWTNEWNSIHPITVDICDFDEVQKIVMLIKKERGCIDVLANNAGLISYELMTMIDYDFFRKMLEVNVVALINITQIVARIMMRQQSGSIINMASLVGEKGAKGQLSYSATKGAVIAITKSASKELAEYHIRVNAIAPGMVGSERFKAVLAEKFADKIHSIPFSRLANPSDIADAYVYFASDMSQYVTGQVLGVDGGLIL